MAESKDSEIGAIQSVIAALEPLDEEARSRVLDYTFKRLGIAEPGSPLIPAAGRREVVPAKEPPGAGSGAPTDIRSLRDEKKPSSANEMAAVVGYYLAELAPEGTRTNEITTAEVKRYFKQAGHRLPEAPSKTLRNAAAAGYFDSVGRGAYALNPVGHNLVTHGLPRAGSSTPAAAPRRRAKPRSGAKGSGKGGAKKKPGKGKAQRKAKK